MNNRFEYRFIEGYSSDHLDINAGVPQGSVLSANLFLLHINDMHLCGTFGYANDSTVTDRYLSGVKAKMDITLSFREAMV